MRSKPTGKHSPKMWEMYDEAEKWLAERLVCSIPELEQYLHEKFHDRWEAKDFDTLAGQRRLKWENLVDWVKAWLAKQKRTVSVGDGRDRLLVYCPSVGWVDPHGALVTRGLLVRVAKLVRERTVDPTKFGGAESAGVRM